jgi:hypothetical protein
VVLTRFFTRTGIHPGSSPGQTFARKRSGSGSRLRAIPYRPVFQDVSSCDIFSLTVTLSFTHLPIRGREMVRFIEVGAPMLIVAYAAMYMAMRYFFPPEVRR